MVTGVPHRKRRADTCRKAGRHAVYGFVPLEGEVRGDAACSLALSASLESCVILLSVLLSFIMTFLTLMQPFIIFSNIIYYF